LISTSIWDATENGNHDGHSERQVEIYWDCELTKSSLDDENKRPCVACVGGGSARLALDGTLREKEIPKNSPPRFRLSLNKLPSGMNYDRQKCDLYANVLSEAMKHFTTLGRRFIAFK